MNRSSPYVGLSTPREIGEALASNLLAPNGRQFMAMLDEVLEPMRDALLEAGKPMGEALRTCREVRQAALAAWHRRAAEGM